MVLSESQEQEVQEMLEESLRKGKLLSASGRDYDVYKEYGNRYAKATRYKPGNEYKPSAREIRGSELRSLYTATPQSQLNTIRSQAVQKGTIVSSKMQDIQNALQKEGLAKGLLQKNQITGAVEYNPKVYSAVSKYVGGMEKPLTPSDFRGETSGRIGGTTPNTYDLAKGTYTSQTGEKTQMTIQEAEKRGAEFILGDVKETPEGMKLIQEQARVNKAGGVSPIQSFKQGFSRNERIRQSVMGQGIIQTATEQGGILPALDSGSIFNELTSTYNDVNQGLVSIMDISGLPKAEELYTGTEFKSALETSQENVPNWLKLRGWEKKLIYGEVGAVQGIYGDIRTKPAKTLLIYGITRGAGALLPGITGAISSISPKLATITEKGIGIAGLGLTGLYGVNVAKEYISAPTPFEKGGVLGSASLNLYVAGKGYSAGSKDYQKITGWLATRNRNFLDIEQGIYPSAPTSKQLSLFQKNIYSELSEKPGMFHTTPSKFWKGEIIAQPGTSELAGLYGSTKISTPFAKITGTEESYSLFGFELPKKPGVAFLTPQGFRYAKVSKIPGVPGKPLGYEWITPLKEGWADIPGIKSEIEAVIRVDSGKYLFQSGKFYTKISGVRVPVDVFSYAGKNGITGLTSADLGTVKLYGGKTSYSGVGDYSKITPSSVSLGIGSSIKSYGTSAVSYSPTSLKSYSPTSSLNYKTSSSYKPVSSSKTISSSMPSYAPSSRKSARSSAVSYSPVSVKTLSSSLTSSKKSTTFMPKSYLYSNSVKRSYAPTSRRKQAPLTLNFKKAFQQPKGSVIVQIRRGGKFKTIGSGLSLQKAMNLGQYKTGSTLSASYRLLGKGLTNLRTPFGYYKKQDKRYGLLFIEKRNRRIKRTITGSKEVPEIQFFRRTSPKRKKKRGFSLF